MAKVALDLAANRNLQKLYTVLKKEAPRFALGVGLLSAIFHAVMCSLTRLKHLSEKQILKRLLSNKFCHMIAGMASAIPIVLIMNPQEQNLLKLFFFPLAFRCLVDKLLQLKLLPNLGTNFGSVISYMLVTTIIGFTYTFESFSLAPSMYRLVV